MTDLYTCGPYAVSIAVKRQHGRNVRTDTVHKAINPALIWYNADISKALSRWRVDHELRQSPNTLLAYQKLLSKNTLIVSVNMKNIPVGITSNRSFITPFVYGHYLTILSYDPNTKTFMVADPIHKLPNGRIYDAIPFINAINIWNPNIIAIPLKPYIGNL